MRSSKLNGVGLLAAAFVSMGEVLAGKARDISDQMRGVLPRMGRNAPARVRNIIGYIDGAGMPHGRSGDKLKRKAMTGRVGLSHARGPYFAWACMAPGRGRARRSK